MKYVVGSIIDCEKNPYKITKVEKIKTLINDSFIYYLESVDDASMMFDITEGMLSTLIAIGLYNIRSIGNKKIPTNLCVNITGGNM